MDTPPIDYETEGDDGPGHDVPPDLLELYEVLEWEAAVAAAGPEVPS